MAENDEVTKKFLTIPLGNALKGIPKAKRPARAIKEIRKHVARLMHEEETAVWIFGDVNEAIWKRGHGGPPMKIRVQIEELEEGHIEVVLPTDEEPAE